MKNRLSRAGSSFNGKIVVKRFPKLTLQVRACRSRSVEDVSDGAAIRVRERLVNIRVKSRRARSRVQGRVVSAAVDHRLCQSDLDRIYAGCSIGRAYDSARVAAGIALDNYPSRIGKLDR